MYCYFLGRGALLRWGPNHTVDTVVLKWSFKENGKPEINRKTNKHFMKFLSVKRSDSEEWAIPGVSSINYLFCSFYKIKF